MKDGWSRRICVENGLKFSLKAEIFENRFLSPFLNPSLIWKIKSIYKYIGKEYIMAYCIDFLKALSISPSSLVCIFIKIVFFFFSVFKYQESASVVLYSNNSLCSPTRIGQQRRTWTNSKILFQTCITCKKN